MSKVKSDAEIAYEMMKREQKKRTRTDADYWERKCLNIGGNPDSLYPAGYKDNRS